VRRILLATALLAAATPAALEAQDSTRWGDELPSTPQPVMPAGSADAPFPAPPLMKPPAKVRALYLTAWVFGSKRFYDLVRLADSTEVNAFVIDVKDDTGYMTYRSYVPTAVAIGANAELRARDTRERLALMHEKGIFPIARIVVAKDPLLAVKKPEWSIQDVDGGLWRDRQGRAWVDAFRDSVWIYAAQLGEEAVKLGFAELQYDYVRFPDEPRSRMARARYGARRPGESNRDGIRRNLTLVRDRVRPLGVPFTLDVFGMTTVAEGDLGIGQVWEDLVGMSDVILPMVYPSHYYRGMYGFASPNAAPYEVVKRALEDGLRRSAVLDSAAEVRPYLQAFTLGAPRYGPEHVRAQMKAGYDLGLPGWVLWNPRSVYDPRIFRPAGATADTTAEVGE
jgi:hypothetical protein